MIKQIIVFLVIFSFFVYPPLATAQTFQEPKETFYKAEVTKIVSEGETFIEDDKKLPYQNVQVKILDGDKKGQELTIEYGKVSTIREDQKVLDLKN